MNHNKKAFIMFNYKGFFKLQLPDKDSNLDKQYQKLSYYHYTIGQSVFKWSAKIRVGNISANIFLNSILTREARIIKISNTKC